MKKLLVVFLAVAMIFAFAATALAADTEIADYTDMADQKAEWSSAVYRLTALGVLEGNTGVGGAFRPADYITRAELAKMVIFLTGNADKVAYYAAQAPGYTDVADGFWAEGYINAAKDLGLMKGVGYGKFNPQGTVSFQETATVVLRALGYTDALKGEWPADYSRKASEIKLISYVDYIGPKAITRAELASIFNEGLDKLMVSYIADSTAQGLGQMIALTVAQAQRWFDDEEAVDAKTLGVDADGFAYNIFYTNSDKRNANYDLLYYAFDATTGSVQFYDYSEGTDYKEGKMLSEANAWGYDDFDDGELLMYSHGTRFDRDEEEDIEGYWEDEVASKYYIVSGGLGDLSNMLADVTFNGDDEILFVDITSHKVQIDSWKDTNEEHFSDVDGKLKVGDVSYKISKKYGFSQNDSPINSTANKEGAFGYLFIDKKGNAYDFKDYYQFANLGHHVVKSVSDTYISYLDPGFDPEKISKLGDFVILKDGKFVELKDLEKGDVIYRAPLYRGEKVDLIVALSPVEAGGPIDRTYTGSDFGFKFADSPRYYGHEMGHNFSYFSVDGLGSLKEYRGDTTLREEFFDENVLFAPAYAFRNFVYASIDVDAYNYGVITDLLYKTNTADSNILNGVTIYTAEGKEVEYKLDKNYDNKSYTDNEIRWTEGSLVEFQLNKDGEIKALKASGSSMDGAPEMWFLYKGKLLDETLGWSGLGSDAERQFTSRFSIYGYNWARAEVEVDKDEATIYFDGETYDLSSDAEIFLVSLKNGLYNKVKTISAEDLLAGGDFDAWQIAACYTSNSGGLTIDTLWIVDRSLADDIKMGYENGGKYEKKDKFYVTLDGTDGVEASEDVYDAWNSRFIVYAKQGDVIDSSVPLIAFNKTTRMLTIPNYDAGDLVGYLVDRDYETAVGMDINGVYIDGASATALAQFKLDDGSSKVYDITIGVLSKDPTGSKLFLDTTQAWNADGDQGTYSYTSNTFYKDLAVNNKKASTIEDMDKDDTVLIVRQGSKVLYVFRLADKDIAAQPV